MDGCIVLPRFRSSRVTSAFVIDLYVGLPLRYTCSGRVGISPVNLTNHFPEANPPNTLTLDQRLTVFVADRRSPRWRSPCFTNSRKLALRLGRNVNPPQVLHPGSSVATLTVTLALTSQNRVRDTSSGQARTRPGRLRPPLERSHRLCRIPFEILRLSS